MGKMDSDLIPTNVVVVGFTGKIAQSHGVTMLKVKIGSVVRDTLFVVVPTKASYNLLLRRDWIHAVGVVPSMAHQKLILWNNLNKMEVIPADDSPCYMQQMHVDFKVYNPIIKPIRLDVEHFQKPIVEKCLVENYGISLVDVEGAVEQRPSTSHDVDKQLESLSAYVADRMQYTIEAGAFQDCIVDESPLGFV